MRVLITGASGFIGSSLCADLSRRGHEVVALRRGSSAGGIPEWDPARGLIHLPPSLNPDAVINLAGQSIAAHRWNPPLKRRILESRVQGTSLLARHMAGLPRPPRVMISASAVGYYGDRGTEPLAENSGPGTGFLAEVCRQWEAAAEPASAAGVRVVTARIGAVLNPHGGALQKMLPVFRWGLGGQIGSGRQYMSWVSLEDITAMFCHALENESLRGPVNFVSPRPATNAEMTRALGRALRRPTLLRVPPYLLRVALGEMAVALLLASTRALPRALETAGYRFIDRDLDATIRRMTGRGSP